ncbi:DUF1028 domain-containing protein [Formosa sediminum]|uniref:DUF1028 domain-containing protein n=1 Tax=Formosa sediminum TaxID=2594004 RepID=A0A516GMN1_9FLAO|nr:DUF1028 domain-containing protein [Formosa sediminum]QDO92759.1 DUF1028 domain-containing protein [Formosa sediminum]
MNTNTVKTVFIIAVLCFTQFTNAQVYKDQFAHTFSIVARDVKTGEMAVGVQSHWFNVGSIVAWGKSGVGVVATQSFVNPAYGPNGIELMEHGTSATAALKTLVEKDEGRDFRQVAMLDVNGNVDAFTGANCVESAHQIIGDNFSVQANMMLNDKVVPAMEQAFKTNSNLPLAERIVKVLQAAQDAGGDIRGRQSAALIVVGPELTAQAWQDKLVELNVEDSEAPLVELERLLKVHNAYNFMNEGDLAVEHGDMKKAMEAYGTAQNMFPENLEMKYWTAIAMANSGQLRDALPIFKAIFEKDNNWRIMTKRLPKSGLLSVSKSELDRILKL